MIRDNEAEQALPVGAGETGATSPFSPNRDAAVEVLGASDAPPEQPGTVPS
jgi:hypothetical protein